MHVGIDISQIVYGTGVSDYTRDLVQALLRLADPAIDYRLFGYSLRRRHLITHSFPTAATYPIPPTVMDRLWNRWHIFPPEYLLGHLDVLHTSDWTQPPTHAAAVTTIHDLSPFLFPQEMASGTFRNIVSVHQAKMAWAVKECRHFICVSHSTAADLIRLFSVPETSLTVIPEALPTRFLLSPDSSPVSGDYLVTIGTPSPRKNLPRLFQAFLEFRSRYRLPEKLVVVGGGGWGKLISPHPSIIFTGYLPDQQLVNVLAHAQALVLPSLYEGFGLPVLLGFHHQVPVVASQVSSFPEVAGQAAVLVDPYSLESIAAGIATALHNRPRFITAGLKRLKVYNWNQTALQTQQIYKNLCL